MFTNDVVEDLKSRADFFKKLQESFDLNAETITFD